MTAPSSQFDWWSASAPTQTIFELTPSEEITQQSLNNAKPAQAQGNVFVPATPIYKGPMGEATKPAEDFTFDLSALSSNAAFDSSYETFAFAFSNASAAPAPAAPLAPSMGYAPSAFSSLNLPQLIIPPPADPLLLDRGLDSPLGLGPRFDFDNDLFDDAESAVPELDLDYFPPQPPAPAQQEEKEVELQHNLRPNPSPPTAMSVHVVPTPAPAPAPAAKRSRGPKLPPPTLTPLPTASVARPHATGFRGSSTNLIRLDAPIQKRNYLTESATSKKRKTTQVERALAKRGKSAAPTPSPAPQAVKVEEIVEEHVAGGEDDEDIPEDLIAAAERKRMQNTLAARASRARKQERLGLLEEENVALKDENKSLKSKVEELEALLRTVGLA